MSDTEAPLPEDSRRVLIVEAARSRMRHVGLAKTTMDMIAEDAGIARPHIYRYFKDKADLVSAVMIAEAAGINLERLKKLKGVTDTKELVIGSFEAIVDVVHANPFWHASAGADDIPLSAHAMMLDPVIHGIREEYWGPILDAAEEAQMLRPDLDRSLTLAWMIALEIMFVERRELFTKGSDTRPYVEAFVLPSLFVGT